MHGSFFYIGLAVAVSLVLSACAVGPVYQRPDTAPPETWGEVEKAAGERGAWPEQTWWQVFSQPDLDLLMETAITQNFDIKAAAARIEQARSLKRITNAELLPDMSVGLGLGLDDKNGIGGATGSSSVSTSLSYEVDLWGKNRSVNDVASARYLGSVYDMRTVVVALTAEVATSYFTALALHDQLGIIEKTIEDEAGLLTLMEKKYRFGDISGLDLALAKQRLASLEAQIPSIEQRRSQSENGLALLLGQNPGEVNIAGSLAAASLPVTIPVGIPSGLLERRADIKRVESDLVAANADIGRAKAALFPTIRLTMEGGYAGEDLLKLLSPTNAFYAIGGEIVTTVFHREKLTAEYDRTTAVYQELLYNYRQTVLAAFREVADALVAIQKLDENERLLRDSAAMAERAYRLSEIRYRQGLTDFSTVLTADKSLLEARNNLVQARLDRIGALISLYTALGGGW